MATPTSSSNRSKRKGTKPITQGQNPQRGNRQKVSNAQVTNSSTRGTNAGSAKVTTGRGASKPAPKALPPGTKGGPLATQGRASLKGQPQLPPGRKGGSVEKAGPTVDVKANTSKLPKSPSGGAITRSSGGALVRLGNATASAAKNLPKAGRTLSGLKGGLLAAALMEGGSRAIDAGVGAYKQAILKERGERAGQSGQYGRYVPGNQQSRGGMGGVGNIPPGEGPRNNPNFGKPASKPPARPSASRPSQSTPSRSTASGSGSQRSTAPQATKPAMPGRKWEDFNPGRGTSKSNNPLLDRDSGGMKLRDRMKQREDAQRSENTKNLKNNFGQDSGYETKTKVDGSMYADKKPDMKKVNEYDRRKKRYYS